MATEHDDRAADATQLVAFLHETADGPFYKIAPSPGRSISTNALSEGLASIALSSDGETIYRRSLMMAYAARRLTGRGDTMREAEEMIAFYNEGHKPRYSFGP